MERTRHLTMSVGWFNWAKYGRDTPPIYNLSKYPTSNHKTVFLSGGKDAARLFEDLDPECVAVNAGRVSGKAHSGVQSTAAGRL